MNTTPAAELQQRIMEQFRAYSDLRQAPDDLLEQCLTGVTATPDAVKSATKAIYAETYYRCAKDVQVTPKEQQLLLRLSMLLQLDDDSIAATQYKVGLAIYKKQFREIVEAGRLAKDAQENLRQIENFFGLRKRDIRAAVGHQALAFYSFRLTDALRDGVLTQSEMSDLALTAREMGLTAQQLQSISVPNKKEILATALAVIKSRGEITEADRLHVRSLADFLNATNDLLKPCLMDLDLYEKIFRIRRGDLPELESSTLILERGEKLHYSIPISYETTNGGKVKRQSGTLHVGSLRMRFVGLRKSHEVRYANLLQVDFVLQKSPKITLAVSSGAGGGNYRMTSTRDPGLMVELQEAIRFLIRKSKGLVAKRTVDSRYIPDEVRSEVWYRDGGQCVMCGSTSYLEFDHVIPRSKGGATSLDNLQLLCRKCNSEKSDSI